MARSHDDFVNIVKLKNPTVEIVGVYTKAQDRIAVKCKECGNEWETSISNRVMGRDCPVCRRKKK